MIPFIRSLSELMAITNSRESKENIYTESEINKSIVDSRQRKRYIRSIEKGEVNLPDLPKTNRRKWLYNKELISKFLDDLDYNNHIQSSYDITLLQRQNNNNKHDVA